MNTIRTIRIATGIKKIELGNENIAMLQIRDVLKQHRDSLISSLLSDLTTYINYHFRTPPKKDQPSNVLSLIRWPPVSARRLSTSIRMKAMPFAAISQ